MAKVISIVNQKGGVGKTTTAVNLSSILAQLGKKILLIDIDPQGNSCSSLGVNKSNIEIGTYELLMNEAKLSEVVIKNILDMSLSLVPATEDLVGAPVELVNEMGREFRLKKALEESVEEYDFVFIDCPPSLELLTLNALAASNSVLIPIQCEFLALEGVAQLLSTIKLVRKNLHPELTIEGVVLTMYDGRTNISNQIVEEVTSYFKEKTFKTIVPRNVRLVEAPSHGIPIDKYDPSCIGAKAYNEIAKEFLAQN